MSKEAIAEFMAHLIISDGHIYSDQVTMLKDFIEEYGLEESQESIFAVLSGKGDERFDALLKELNGLDAESEELLLQNAAAIIGFDCHFAKEEREAVEKLCASTGVDRGKLIRKVEEIISQAEKANRSKKIDDLSLDGFDALSLKVRRFFASGARREYLSSKIKQSKLSGPEYADAIRLTNSIAEVDCRLVEDCLEDCFDVMEKTRVRLVKNLNQHRPKQGKVNEEERDNYDFIKGLSVDLDRQMRDAKVKIKDVVDKKKRAKNAFTIALMGRTKAGKSTLHYIMTGEGKDFIGVGAERTTRFNRVYEWENLRIIDTPGIGAAEAGGRTDEEIALSVVDTSDVICYVVTNDSVQEVEFQFLSKIRDSNKPVFILLNCKENLSSPPPKLKRFMDDPLHWYTRSDEQNLQGIVNRIERGVSCYYEGGSVTIIPVHLMAAKMAREEKYSVHSEVLDSGSRMNEFFNEIRENVIELGRLRKSQTLLDNTSYRLAEMRHEIMGKREKSLRLANDIQGKMVYLLGRVKERSSKGHASFLSELKSSLENEKSHALEFASENYNLKKSKIESYWSQEVKEISEKLKGRLEAQLQKASEEVKDYIDEAIEDISLGVEHQDKGEFGDYDTLNTRRIASLLGALASAGGGVALFFLGTSNPVGWVAIGAGAVIGVLSGFMTSKEEKKRKAVEHMKKQVDASIQSMEKSYKEHAKKVFSGFQAKMEGLIRDSLQKVEAQYRVSAEELVPYLDSLDRAINILNSRFAIRIIEFIREESILEALDPGSYPVVDRTFGSQIEISSHIRLSEKAVERAEKALREKIFIKYVEKEKS